jgi:hypothetical protein
MFGFRYCIPTCNSDVTPRTIDPGTCDRCTKLSLAASRICFLCMFDFLILYSQFQSNSSIYPTSFQYPAAVRQLSRCRRAHSIFVPVSIKLYRDGSASRPATHATDRSELRGVRAVAALLSGDGRSIPSGARAKARGHQNHDRHDAPTNKGHELWAHLFLRKTCSSKNKQILPISTATKFLDTRWVSYLVA